MNSDIQVNRKELDDLLNTMNSMQASKFMFRVMNKLSERAKTAAIKKIRSTYYMPKSGIDITTRSVSLYEREIVGKGRPTPLDHFKYQKASIGVLIKRRKDRTDFLRFAFVQRMPNGKIGIFKQVQPFELDRKERRAKIEKVFAPSIPDILEGDNIRIEVQQVVADAAPAVIDQEFNYIMNIEGKR